jgi:Uma2 family endonuclease
MLGTCHGEHAERFSRLPEVQAALDFANARTSTSHHPISGRRSGKRRPERNDKAMAIAPPALRPYRFSRAEYYAIADSLDPSLRYELLDGTIYAMSPAKPPHAGVVDFFLNRLRALDPTIYQLRSQAVVEIEPDGSPEPDVAVLTFRSDYYATSHPNGGDAHLVIEVGDAERNPREKMSKYMRDGRIPHGWRIDIPNRCVELWEPSDVELPIAILGGSDGFGFEGVTFTIAGTFAILESPK